MASLTIAKCLLFGMAVALAAAHAPPSAIVGLDEFREHLESRMNVFAEARHPRPESSEAWEISRAYIERTMGAIGFSVELQHFNSTVKFDDEDDREVVGCNVIGISRGPSTKNLLVVGAHYDSSGVKKEYTPMRDNGVGIFTLLEVARAYEESIRWKGFTKNYTTIFVAFDLNTKEQFPESSGHTGSYNFVKNWLTPMLMKQRRSLAGSFILDSIAIYNTEEDTQTLPADFKTVFPEAFEMIDNDSRKGDFLAAVSNENSQELTKEFAGHYRMDRMTRQYRLQELITKGNNFGTEDTLHMFNHQASLEFWLNKPSLPCVLLTDTGNKRVFPSKDQCSVIESDDECDYTSFLTKERAEFVHHTYRALAETLLDRQTTFTGLEDDSGSSTAVPSSALALVLMAALARLMAA